MTMEHMMVDPAVVGSAGVTATVMGALGVVIRHLEKKQMARNGGYGRVQYVTLSADDAARAEKVVGLLDRLISLEEKTQEAIGTLTEDRIKQAERHGELLGAIRARG